MRWISVVAVIIICIGCAASPKRRMIDMTRDVVTLHLKSPDSAKFGELSCMWRSDIAEDVYTVSGWVDSQNGYGAQLRTRFTFWFVMEGDGPFILRKEWN